VAEQPHSGGNQSAQQKIFYPEQLNRPNGLRVPELLVRFCSHPRVFVLRIMQPSKKKIHDVSNVPILADNLKKQRPGLHPKLGDAANPLFQKL
jgi:hypothetical protein